MQIIRRGMTLLEVLIVITILSLASGIVAISINKAIVDQRFRSEVDMVVNELRMAQDLMLILGTDVHVHFKSASDGNGIEYYIELETMLPENVSREVTRAKPLLKTIRGVFLQDELLREVKEDHIDVKFLSNGAVMSKGIMRLASSSDETVPRGTLESFICLAGYPKPILSTYSKEEAEESCPIFDKGNDDKLTRDTILRLPERLKKRENSKEEEEKDNKKDKEKTDKKNDEKDKNKLSAEGKGKA